MFATLEKLVAVRSQLAEDLLAYYEALIDHLDPAPWPRQKQFIRASEIAIPPRVLKEEIEPLPSPLRGREDEAERHREPARNLIGPEIAAFYEEPTMLKRREEVAWNVERQRVQRAVIIGAPGGGKSFLTAITAIEVAQEAQRRLRDQLAPLDSLAFPIHLELADLAEPKLPADPADALMELFRLKYKPSARLEVWVREKLTTEQCWLILDALDQVDDSHRPVLNDRLKAIETQGWQCRIVLTCRRTNYDRAQVPWGKVTEYELAPFNPHEIRQFVEKWFGAGNPRGETLRRVLGRSYPLSHACRSPLIVTLACLVHEEGEVTEETRRVDLYARVLRNLVRRAWKNNPLNPLDPHIGDILRPLPEIARTLFELRPESNQFTEDEFFEAIKAVTDLPSEPIPFRDELLGAGILVGEGLSNMGELQFSFLHRTFLEYLTACALNQRVERNGWQEIAAYVDKKSLHAAWQEVIVMLAGNLADATPLLKLLADRKKDNYFRHRLTLASLCLPEVQLAVRIQQPALIDQITTVAFSLWWKAQKESTLAEMPHLTRSLPALGQINGKMKGVGLLEWVYQRSKSPERWERMAALEAIQSIGNLVPMQSLFVHVAALLHQDDEDIAYKAATFLGRMAILAPSWLNLLTELFQGAHPRSVRLALVAVRSMGNAAATPFILERIAGILSNHGIYLMEDMEDTQQVYEDILTGALDAVATIGSAAATPVVLRCLAELLCCGNRFAQQAAAVAVRSIGVPAATPAIIAGLTDLLHHWDKYVQEAAAKAIQGMQIECFH